MNTFLIGILLVVLLLFLFVVPKIGKMFFIFIVLFGLILFFVFSYKGSSFNLSTLSNPETGLYRGNVNVHWWTEDGSPRIEIVGVSFTPERKYDVPISYVDEIKNIQKTEVYILNIFVDDKFVCSKRVYEYSGTENVRVGGLAVGEHKFGVEVLDVDSNKKDYTEKSEVINE